MVLPGTPVGLAVVQSNGTVVGEAWPQNLLKLMEVSRTTRSVEQQTCLISKVVQLASTSKMTPEAPANGWYGLSVNVVSFRSNKTVVKFLKNERRTQVVRH